MELSEKTVEILKNFQVINPSIKVWPGNQLMTESPSGAVSAVAKVPDSFPRAFAVYDLAQLLSILSLQRPTEGQKKEGLTGNEIEFEENSYMTIRQGNTTVNYYFCDANLIYGPDEDEEYTPPEPFVQFHLTSQVLSQILKAMLILKYNMLSFQGDGKNIYVAAINPNADEQTTYSTQIGDTSKTFNVFVEIEKLKIMEGDYFVTIADGVIHFKGENVEYYIATHSDSTYE